MDQNILPYKLPRIIQANDRNPQETHHSITDGCPLGSPPPPAEFYSINSMARNILVLCGSSVSRMQTSQMGMQEQETMCVFLLIYFYFIFYYCTGDIVTFTKVLTMS
jgi:hypothetical protein